jgi:hypothetical protein
MKLIVIFSVVITTLFFNRSNNMILVSSEKINSCDSIPGINKNIIAFVKTKIGKKVGKGECWDLAAEALNSASAKWDGNYGFGKEVNYKKDCVYPGDIIQFEGVILKYEIDKKKFIEKMAHHTAIIYEIKGKEEFIIADQNTGRSGKKVGVGSLDLKTITKGKFKFFRPTN